MPIKRVVCHICKVEVNKAQTYAMRDGNRACRTHEGVTEQKEQLQDERLRKQQENVKRALDGERRRSDQFYSHQPMSLKPRCWVCKNEGMRSEEFFTRLMIEKAKSEMIHGPCNPFDPKHPGNQIKMTERCIFVLAKQEAQNAMKYLHGDFETLVNLAGAVAICGPCCKTLKIDPMPKIEFDEILKFAAISETFIQPVIKSIAKVEMGVVN